MFVEVASLEILSNGKSRIINYPFVNPAHVVYVVRNRNYNNYWDIKLDSFAPYYNDSIPEKLIVSENDCSRILQAGGGYQTR